ncbi:hypothetical protein M2650_11735 [Luteimonas sp. SX5]|uniref:DUF2268 domain-containing protein n=1 Tax=Luteimonas galliterrae TaxID=2940486 RepID=A0ABT0MK91_9GAMM|nr:DUF5700 domain-containing putative Zn-dependent protease [Luteimonas galliterrae]MCL1635296.1 hypothetical protein [Luteimonas galliterrae]
MKNTVISALVAAAVMAMPASSSEPEPAGAVDVKFDIAEAEAALAIFEKQAKGDPVTERDWQALFSTAGYRRLKDREDSMGRSFTDAEFKAFMEEPRTLAQIAALRRVLREWSSQPIEASARVAFAYLPADARMKATIFPMIKPKKNEFVYDTYGDPAIFLYLDPDVSAAKARNTMIHELHHIGQNSVCPRKSDKKIAPDQNTERMREWTGSFSEGLAVLAAAGGPRPDPLADRGGKEQADWDRNVARFGEDMAEQNAYFLSVLDSKAGDEAAVRKKMMGYFGIQGPWYTVGWKMATTIETQFGRQRVIDAFCDPGQLLSTYNQAAALQNQSQKIPLPLWDARLAASLAR